ncbi:beta-ketoacyl-[acyl-carrier-protein] synthase family protein [Actinomadura sp. KC345]|uniref:beta-ketoacyl-[acyl-carrier-protein] synthase family protein n=1 Tax=Actinomadura sp. KC345 TaxID=2530371 RepID=UPI001051B90A|nr:beta-ketoacyl-[acyl-carrier-protein] synthase family protein [Actinomadura sp. KC345]TDC41456.1 beta-ketoacyl-[acyl-carrier-protein] synthase family protein [Actinomadura sp. KC345]
MDDVVITGWGAVSPLGIGADRMLAGLRDGEVAIGPAPWSGKPGVPFGWWAGVPGFRPHDWMDERVVAGTDLFAQFALAAAVQAVEDAGLGPLDPERTAVVHGTSIGGGRALLKAQHDYDTGGTAAVERKTMIQIWPNMAAAQIAMRWGLHGPQLTVCTACASSLDAIGLARTLIRAGQADVAIVGGTEGGLPLASGEADGDFVPAMFVGQAAYGMTTAERDPARASLPFDVDRSGIVTGEGSAALVLESAGHARARGARARARVAGFATLADGHHPSSPEPHGLWEARAMRSALEDAGLPPAEVGALVAHATATPKGDAAEIKAINSVHGGAHGGRAEPLPVTSLKGHLGHTGAASGAMGVIAAGHAMDAGGLPHVAGTARVEPEAEFDVIIGRPIELDVGVAQINAFGFGGQDASLVLCRP